MRAKRERECAALLGAGEVESLGGEVGEHEGGGVELGAVVLELGLEVSGDLAEWLLGVGRAVLGGEEETERTAWVGRGLSDGVGDRGEDLADELLHRRDEVQVQPDALGLRSEDAVLSERLLDVGEVGLIEELGRWACGVGGIGDDHVELVLVLLDELETVTNVDLNAGVLISDRRVGQVLLSSVDYDLIDLADVQLLNRRVAGELTQDSSVSSSNHQHLLGVGVCEHRQMGDGLFTGNAKRGTQTG